MMKNTKEFEELFNELELLNEQYKLVLKEIINRGIENSKNEAKEWTDEKIENLRNKIEKISVKMEDIGQKVEKGGKIALGLGILGVEATIKGAKTLGNGIKNKFKEANNKVLGEQIAIKRELREKKEAIRKARREYIDGKKEKIGDWIENKKEIADATKTAIKDNVKEKKDNAKEWVEDKVDNVKIVKNIIKGDVIYRKDRLIKGAKTLGNGIKNKFKEANNKVLGEQIAIKRELREKKEAIRRVQRKYIDGKKEKIGDWIENKKEIVDATKTVIKDNVQEKIGESIEKAEEFVDLASEAKKRFEQRKNQTLLGIVGKVKNTAISLESKLQAKLEPEKATEKQGNEQQTKVKKNEELGRA